MRMKNFISLFFVIGAFAFLYWFMPIALQDNKVTLFEMFVIWTNGLCLIANLYNIMTEVME